MTITRRSFGKMVGSGVGAMAAVGTLGMTTMGISCGSIFADITAYVPVGMEAFQALIVILDPPVALALAPIITAAKAAFADLAAAVAAYNNAPAANKATLVGKISTAINAVIGELQQFWSDANLPNGGLASTISGVLQIILSTLAAFLPLLGPAPAATRTVAKTLPYTSQKRTQKQFKADVNAVLKQGGYSQVVY